jgi:small subunit ribosomal protein S3
MSHKVHPKVFRIKGTSSWQSRGFYGKKPLKYIKEDFEIREFLYKKFKDCSVEKIEIERFLDKINIIIETARPAFIIGRAGRAVEDLRKEIEQRFFSKKVKKEPKELKIEIKAIKDPWTKAGLCSQWIASSLEKRFPFRKTLKQALEKIMAHKEVKGARVEVAGRLDGIEISRTEWLAKGRLPRQTLRADVDYGFSEAHCSYGSIGVKVWIYNGEKL